jgi:hypothetical protein
VARQESDRGGCAAMYFKLFVVRAEIELGMFQQRIVQMAGPSFSDYYLF